MSVYLEVTNNLLQLLSEADWEENKLDDSLLQDLFRSLLYNFTLPTDKDFGKPSEERVEAALRIIFNEVEQITHDGLCDGLPQYVHDIIDSYKAENP
jgi:hypothetical protein